MAVIRDQQGRVSELHGLPIRLEAYAGTYRTKPGKQPILIASDYGEIMGTVGADGDPLDCYVGVFPEVLNIYVINQATAAGGFDEHKVMFGFLSQAEAVTAYQLSTFNKEPLSVIPCTMAQFNWWLKFGNKKAETTVQSFPFDPESEIAMQQNIFDWGQPKAAAGLAIYDMGRVDQAEELNEAVTYDDMMETILAEGGEFSPEVVMDALVIQQQMLSRKARQIGMALNRIAGGDIQVKEEGIQISEPYKINGTTNVAVIFEMTDGQTISVFMHNPDASPKTIKPTDNLIAWRWLLNRKDITIVVAKENGRDQQINIIARKVMALVEANAGRFQRANKRRTEREAALGGMQAQVEAKRAVLAGKLAEIEQLKVGVASVEPAEPTAAPVSAVEPEGLNPSNEGLNPVGAKVPAPEVPKDGNGANEGVKPMASRVVTLTGNELGHVDETTKEGKQQLRTQAKALFEDMLGDWVDCPALGGKVEIRKRGMKKVLSASRDPRKLKVVAGLKSLITVASKLKTVAPYNANEDPSAVAYHILQAPVQLGDDPLSVRIVVKEDQQGEFHYDHSIHPDQAVFDSAQEKSPTGVELNSVATSDDRGTDPSRIASHELDSSIAVLDEVVNNDLVLNLFFVDEAGVVIPEAVDESAPNLPDDEPSADENGQQLSGNGEDESGQAVTVEPVSVAEPAPEPENLDPDFEQDRAFLQSVIDDGVDVLADDFADKLLAVAEKYQGDEFPEMQVMVDAAAAAYTNKLEQLTA